MSLPGNGIFVVQGEMAILVTAMRRGVRWGSMSGQDEEHDLLMRGFQDLRDILNQVADLRLLDPNVFLGPFLEVIRSERTTGTVTCLALSAINKFLCYGLIDPMHSSVPATVENIADAITHARFVGTDHSSDSVVLMKIVQVLRTLVLSPEGAMLTDESICEIMLSCFRICFENRLSELLRLNAEQCLRDMIQLVFMRLPQFNEAAGEEGRGRGALSLRRKNKHKDNSMLEDSKTSVATQSNVTKPLKSQVSSNSDAQNVDTKNSETPNNARIVTNEDDTNCKASVGGNTSQEAEKENNLNLKPELVPAETQHTKSPLKKHGRHSSMDLASNDNIYITQLVEKCVHSSESQEKDSQDGAEVNDDTDLKDKIDGQCASSIENSDNAPEIIDYKEEEEEEEKEKDYVNPRGVRFTTQDEQLNLQPYGLASVRELFRFLISLCNPLDSQNTQTMVHIGLSLVQTALEVGADHLTKYPSFLQLVKDPLCRNLLSLLSSDRSSVITLDLQVSFLLFESLRTHLKFQMESFFVKLVEIVMSDGMKNTYESKEITHLALESIALMWKIPGLCTELYLNYDCDTYSSNLFEDIIKLLSKTIVTAGVHNYHSVALDALFTVIDSIEANCLQVKSNNKLTYHSSNEDLNVSNEDVGHVAIDMGESSANDDESVIHDISQYISGVKMYRHKPSLNIPTPEELERVKTRKRWIATGTEHFNQKPEKGIEFLQEHDILASPLDPVEVAHFLRNNPGLDKKMIGEYISKKKNVELRILAKYVDSFDMTGLRIDQALRLYLETFRLPGEAPLIFLVMEHFAEHWHISNGNPFANQDAAFSLAYAIIMLNMDQHNHNAKKLNVPMNVEDFVKNLRGCNGGGDFDQAMLETIFNSIKNEEMVMPAERSGLVKENYLWRVLLRRGATKEGLYTHCRGTALDKQLFLHAWGPMVAALSSIFEKCAEPSLYNRSLEGFDKCASIVAHLSLTTELDTIILSLCKFTGLLSLPDNLPYISIGTFLGQSEKCRSALKKVFSVCQRHANSLREGWKHILDVVLALFKGHLLPKCLIEAEDFCAPTGKVSLITEPSQQSRAAESGLFSSLYSYIALTSDPTTAWQRQPTVEEAALLQQAAETVSQCNVQGLLITDSKFLQLDSLQELTKYVITAGKNHHSVKSNSSYRDDPTVFYLELLIKIVIQNRDRVSHIWPSTEHHITGLMKSAAQCYLERPAQPTSGLLERASTGLLKLAICLMRSEECASMVLSSLKAFLDLTYPVYHSIANRISIGLFELVKTSAQNIHSADDWGIVFTLLETTGAGAMHLKDDDNITGSKSDGAVSSEEDSVSTDRGYTSDSELSQSPHARGWIMVGKHSDSSAESPGGGMITEDPLVHPCRLRAHDPHALLKCWECLAFIVRDVAHITPYNFHACVNCIRTFVEASLNGSNEEKIRSPHHIPGKHRRRQNTQKRVQNSSRGAHGRSPGGSDDSDEENVPDGYQLISIQLLDLMHTLHSRTAQIFKWWREEANLTSPPAGESNTAAEWCDLWHLAWQPLLQGIARLCTDNRKQVANSAVTYLQRALLVHDLQTLSGEEWEAAFHRVLFPLLARPQGKHQEVRLRANTIMCKVFLHHLTPLMGRPSFPSLWLHMLGLLRCNLQGGPLSSDLLHEATLESLKNMLLVMDSVKVFNDGDGYSELWDITWERINTFLPNLKQELFPNVPESRSKQPAKVNHPQDNTSPSTPLLSSDVPSPTSEPPALQSPSHSMPPSSHATQISNIPPTMPAQSPQIPIPSPQIPIQLPQIPTQSPTANKHSSIILQPPAMTAQITPLLAHTGQIMNQPIGMAVPVSSLNAGQNYPILCPNPIPQKYYNSQMVNTSTVNSQLLNVASQQNQYTGFTSPSFTLVSPQRSQETNQYSDNSNNILTPAISNANIIDAGAGISIETQQPGSLYVEYLTNPYSSIQDESCQDPSLSGPSSLLNVSFTNPLETKESRQLSGSMSSLDTNFNVSSNLNVSNPKSQSVTSSPLHNASHNVTTVTFGSSENIRTQVNNPEEVQQSSGMFSFSKYFYTDSSNIPPGSEILYGDNSLPINE